MPETPPDWEDYLPAEERDDHFVTVQMPRSALRSMQRDAKAHRRAVAEQGGPQAVANVAAGLNPDGSTILEPGEAGQTAERRSLFDSTTPPDRPALADPYVDAQRAYDRVFAAGGLEKQAIGAAFATIVQAGIKGDRRVILRDSPGGQGGE